jgi:hypothetical protein
MYKSTKYKILSSLLTFPAWRNAKYQHMQGAYCPSPMLLFYIPSCRKTCPAWRNVIYQHGRRKKCSVTNRVFSHSQKCNFPEESLVLSTFCHSVGACPKYRRFMKIQAFSLSYDLATPPPHPLPLLSVSSTSDTQED